MLQDQNNRRRIDILEREIKSLRGMVSKLSTATPRIDRDLRQIRLARTVNGVVDGQDEPILYPVQRGHNDASGASDGSPNEFRIEYLDWSFQMSLDSPPYDLRTTGIDVNTRRSDQRSYQNTAVALDESYYPVGSLVVVLCEFGQAVIVGNFGGNLRPLVRFTLDSILLAADSYCTATISSGGYGPGADQQIGQITVHNPPVSTDDHQYFGTYDDQGWGLWWYGTHYWIIDLECPGV